MRMRHPRRARFMQTKRVQEGFDRGATVDGVDQHRLQRARQQSFYADAALNLAATRHKAAATREALVRMLGLTTEQAAQLKLPDRLPDLPETPKAPSEVAKQGENRLDVRMAKQGFDASAKAQGLGNVASFLDIEAGIRYDTIFENDTGERNNKKGYELELALPIFDWGGMKRDTFNANTLAAANRLEATLRSAQSTLRESYSAYRTTYGFHRVNAVCTGYVTCISSNFSR